MIILIVYAIYIIHRDGVPLFSKVFQAPSTTPPEEILSGLLASIQHMSIDLVKQTGSAESFKLKGVVYHLKYFGEIQVVIVTNSDERPIKAMNRLGLHFLKDYGEKLSGRWTGDVSMFEKFESTVESVVDAYFEFDRSFSIDPSKRLTTTLLFSLKKELKNTAIALVTLKEGTVEQIAEESGEDTTTVIDNLAELQNLGYIGVKKGRVEKIYFY